MNYSAGLQHRGGSWNLVQLNPYQLLPSISYILAGHSVESGTKNTCKLIAVEKKSAEIGESTKRLWDRPCTSNQQTENS